MKNKIKWFGLFAIMAVIVFSFSACGGGDADESNNQTPVAGDYIIDNLSQTAGSVTAVTITPKSGKSTGARSIKYAGSAAIPQTAGTYAVTFDVAAATGWNAASNLSAGNLVVNPADVNLQTPETPQPFNDITAAQLIANIKIGWNLGNTLDAAHLTWLPANPTVTEMETGWNNPVTTKAMITAIKTAGFNGIRIPVSWTKAAGGAPDYTIRADWMARVVEVVNYAADNDMYIILNTHHDEDVLTFMNSNAAAGKAAFQKLWEQIASTFKNYNEKLIFEGLNEPRTIDSANEWDGGTAEERANLNSYYPIFVNTVRTSGGNNDKRCLMINTYAASYVQTAVDGLTLPTDTVANKLIVSIHAYTPYDFCYPFSASQTPNWSTSNSSDTGAIHSAIQPVYDKFASKGIPVIIGEFGSVDKNNTSARAAWAEYYVSYAKSKGIVCFLWDNDLTYEPEKFGIFNRSNNTFHFPEIKDALMRGAASTNSGGETVVGSYNANESNPHISLSSSVNYQVVNLTGESRTNVLKVVNPTEWAAAFYDLSSYKDQNKTFSFSAEVKRVGAAGELNWQINNSDYPSVGKIENASAGTWHSMSGTWTGTPNDSSPRLYLSTHENNSSTTTYYIDNFTITVTP